MPGLNGTGPRGLGQSTGRGLGNCEQSAKVGYTRGRGCGRGLGRGFGRVGFQSIDSKESLHEEKKLLEDRLTFINKELDK